MKPLSTLDTLFVSLDTTTYPLHGGLVLIRSTRRSLVPVADLVAHYLDPARRPPRVKAWSDRHRDEQVRYCNLYVLPIIGDLPCRQLTRDDFQQILDQASTPSVAKHLRACLTGLVNAGLDEGHLLVRQDLLRRVRWHGETTLVDEPVDRAVTEGEIPTVEAVHALAAAAAARAWTGFFNATG